MSDSKVDSKAAEASGVKLYPDFKKTALGVIRGKCQTGGKAINDRQVFQGAQECLDIINTKGVIINFGKTSSWYVCFGMDFWKLMGQKGTTVDGLIQALKLQLGQEPIGCLYTKVENGISCLRIWLENMDSCSCDADNQGVVCWHRTDHVFLVEPNLNVFTTLSENSEPSSEEWFPIASTFREIFLHRNHAYRHFPLELSLRYWNHYALPAAQIENMLPPWANLENSKLTSTYAADHKVKDQRVDSITLSLDLRKSTIAMEQATDLAQFADWMRDLIETLTEIALNHYAVFDKFTGDGVMVHFLEKDVQKLLPTQCSAKCVIEQALLCAARMIEVVEQRLEKLRDFLQSDFSGLGAGVGLAAGKALWSVDHTGNPIVVGRGVVSACRAVKDVPAGVIRLTNTAYRKYRRTLLHAIAEPRMIEIENSKDFPEKLVLRCWDIPAQQVLAATNFSEKKPPNWPGKGRGDFQG